MTSHAQRTWFITGASTGFGREMAHHVLARGGRVVATARKAEAVADIVGVVRRTPHGERLTFNVNARTDLTVPVDESDFSEILGNLIENAARFAKSTIRVDVAVDEKQRTIISVADDGPGLAEAEHQSALRRGMTTKDDGSGLGLAIVSDIVAAYSGSLKMSDAKPGLLVTVSLPRPT